eukprot:CAMPEP_0179069968 /NCGR_PEP_ID=MMETSP0796-20121207/30779_1 /TAXON_ID=73915 /ORGANISM="Pyrodinium bahamense, Strain pbaha01" /LENGTH=131 /DNA_ID=CAMNT_0020767047 /DNA_START=65 /DNA_END=460 /DNA_ORIENTATION=+
MTTQSGRSACAFVVGIATFFFLAADSSAAGWRDRVQGLMGAETCPYDVLRVLQVEIDSEMLQKSQDDMALLALAGDLQQHRRLPGLPDEVSDLLDEKARGIGKLGSAVMKTRMTSILINGGTGFGGRRSQL